MYYPEWMKNLAELDTDEIKAARRAEYWYLLEISCCFLTWNKKSYILSILQFGCSMSLYAYLLPCEVVTLFKLDDVAEFGQCLNWISLALISLATLVMSTLKRHCLISMWRISAAGFYDYGDSSDHPQITRLKRIFGLMRKFLLVLLPSWMFLIAVSVLAADYVDETFHYNTTTTNVDYINGVYQRLPVKFWYFNTIDSEFKRYLMLAGLTFGSVEIGWLICSADLVLIFGAQNIILQMRSLIIKTLDTDERANDMYKRKYGKRPSKNGMRRRKDAKLMECYKLCIKQLAEHHSIICRYFESYQEIVNWPAGVALLNGAILVAMSCVTLIQGGGRPNMIITSFLLVVAEMSSLFIMCELGEVLTSLNEEEFDALYQFEWMDCSKEVMKGVRILKTRLARPLVLKAALTVLNRDAFAAMMKTAYSYVNVMVATG